MTDSPRPSLRFRRPHRRGAVYLAVLGTSMIVALIGISAMLTSRALQQAGATTHRATEARYVAHSAVELALLHLANDPNWRTTHTHGQWTAARELGAGKWRYRLLSASSSRLDHPADGHVWLEAEGRVGDAVRLMRVALQPASQVSGRNFVRNPDMADGTRYWTSLQALDQLEYTLMEKHVGAGSLRLRNHAGGQPGAMQDVTGRVENGKAYRVDLAIHLLNHNRQAHVRLMTTNTAGVQTTASQTLASLTATTWTEGSVTLIPTWTGELASAVLEVRLHSHGDFLLDAVAIVPEDAQHVMLPVPGTWQQLVQ